MKIKIIVMTMTIVITTSFSTSPQFSAIVLTAIVLIGRNSRSPLRSRSRRGKCSAVEIFRVTQEQVEQGSLIQFNGDDEADMEFVKNFTPSDFQAKNFTPSVSPYFYSFSDKNTKK